MIIGNYLAYKGWIKIINYAKIKDKDIVNGEGIRVSIFFSGCNFRCENCFNSELWDFNYGAPFTSDTIGQILKSLEPNYISGLSILGGEPLHQDRNVLQKLLTAVKKAEPNKNIWLWTGYDFEEIPKDYRFIFDYIDVLVTGRYVDKLKDLTLKFRGSSNQKIWRKSIMPPMHEVEWRCYE